MSRLVSKMLQLIHAPPSFLVTAVTQIPVTAKEDIYHEVKAEEFIVDPFTPQSVSKAQNTPTPTEMVLDGEVESHQTPVVFQESQQLSSDTMTEGSGQFQTAPLRVSEIPTTQSGMDVFSGFQVSNQSLIDSTAEGSADPMSSTRLFEGSGFFPNAAASRSVKTRTVVSETTTQTPQQTFTDFFTEGSTTGFGEGSGRSPITTQSLASTMGLVVDGVGASTTSEMPKTSTTIQDVILPGKAGRLSLQRAPKEDKAETEKLSDIKELINGKLLPNEKCIITQK